MRSFQKPKQDNTHVDRGDGAMTKSDAVQLAFARWEKLAKDFYKPKTQSYDPSKIPDIFDCVKFDIMHTPELFNMKNHYLLQIYPLAKRLAEIVVPQEYGLDSKDKMDLGALAVHELLRKLRDDLITARSEGQEEEVDMPAGEFIFVCCLNVSERLIFFAFTKIDAGHSRRVSETSQISGDSKSFSLMSPKHVLSPRSSAYKVFEEPDVLVGPPVNSSGLPPIKVMSSSKGETQHRLDKTHAKQVGIKSSDRHVRTRLYFTSESHMHSMLNVIRFAHLADDTLPSPSRSALVKLEETEELGYLSHIVFRLFEVMSETGEKRFSLRVAFSPGVPLSVPVNDAGGLQGPISVGCASDDARLRLANQLPPASPFIPLWSDLDLDQALLLLNTMISQKRHSGARAHPGLQRAYSAIEGGALERPFSRIEQ